VGGDFYDVFPIDRDTWLLAIGDVQGKGPRAAAVTGLARYTIRAAASRGADSAEVITTLNEALLREEGGRRFLTLVYATLDLSGPDPRMTVANAGHPLPLVVRASGGVEPVGDHGLLLGVAPDPLLAEAPLTLERGDALVLYTDGVIEALTGDGSQLGEDGLQALLENCAEADAERIADLILGAALDDAGVARDDVAVLVVRRL
jgi:serine phosphatase RsbU (regulator of sigma subunit)